MIEFQPLNESITESTLTNSTLEFSTMSGSEAKSEQFLNYMDYGMMTGHESKDSQVNGSNYCYVNSPPPCISMPEIKESEVKNVTLQECQSSAETKMQSEKMYNAMSESMTLLQSTKSEIFKILAQPQNERQNDATLLDSIEKKRKELLTKAIHKIRSHVDELEHLSRMF